MLLNFFPTPVPEGEYTTPIGVAEVKKPGADVTVVTWSKMLGVAFKAAAQLEARGIGVEIVDLRSLNPLDEETILASVRKTGRLVVLHEATRLGGFGGEIAALAAEKAFPALKAPIQRVAAPDIPVPFSKPLEDFYLPNEGDLIAAIERIVR